jgi:hypothetical protein
MAHEEEAGTERRVRRFRSVAEKRRIAELTFAAGASVALVARAYGGNTNQVFKWRRELKKCELIEAVAGSTALLPVSFSTPCRLCEPCRPFLYWRRPPSLVLQTLTKVRGAMSHPKDSIRPLALPMSPSREWRAA